MLNDAKLTDTSGNMLYIHLMIYAIVFLIVESTISYSMERLNKSKVDYLNIRVFGCKIFLLYAKIFKNSI